MNPRSVLESAGTQLSKEDNVRRIGRTNDTFQLLRESQHRHQSVSNSLQRQSYRRLCIPSRNKSSDRHLPLRNNRGTGHSSLRPSPCSLFNQQTQHQYSLDITMSTFSWSQPSLGV